MAAAAPRSGFPWAVCHGFGWPTGLLAAFADMPLPPASASAGANPASGPHVYGVGAATYRGLLDAKSQSVIISGESGAGKTETAKRFLQYLAYRGVCSVGGAAPH